MNKFGRNVHATAILVLGYSVLDRILDQRLQDQRRYGKSAQVGWNIDLYLQPFLKPRPLDIKIAFYQPKLVRDGAKFVFGGQNAP